MATLFNHAIKQSQFLKRDLEKFAAAPEDAPAALPGQISSSITSFQRAIESYAAAARNELVPEKKVQAEERVDRFRAELTAAREELARLRAVREESHAQQVRQELFERRSHVAPAASENPFAGGSGPTHTDRNTGLNREADMLSRAGAQLDEFIEYSRHALDNLGDQNAVLHKTQTQMRRVASTLGISQDTIRRVERRAKEDKFVFYGGAAALFGGFYFIWRLLKG